MKQRLSIITLGVGELGHSAEFYERLGWKRSAASSDGIVFFQVGGMALALYPRGELAKDANAVDRETGFRAVTLAYNTRSHEEVDVVLAEAARAGAKIIKAAAEAFWGGYSGYFADPDGFLWEVAWNPFFEVGEDGELRLER